MSAERMAEPPPLRKASGEDWVARLTRLQELVTACPSDILSRCELAVILETLGQYQEALFNWREVLACEANNLKAREGMARCRRLTG
jgi:hypothetical protein